MSCWFFALVALFLISTSKGCILLDLRPNILFYGNPELIATQIVRPLLLEEGIHAQEQQEDQYIVKGDDFRFSWIDRYLLHIMNPLKRHGNSRAIIDHFVEVLHDQPNLTAIVVVLPLEEPLFTRLALMQLRTMLDGLNIPFIFHIADTRPHHGPLSEKDSSRSFPILADFPTSQVIFTPRMPCNDGSLCVDHKSLAEMYKRIVQSTKTQFIEIPFGHEKLLDLEDLTTFNQAILAEAREAELHPEIYTNPGRHCIAWMDSMTEDG